MKHICFWLSFCVAGLVAIASSSIAAPLKPLAVLLTSFKQPLFQSETNYLLERRFVRDVTKKGFRYQIVHHANAKDLEIALKNPEVRALFWLTHGSSGAYTTFILDESMHSVDAVFKLTQPTLVFLGLIACGSESFQKRLNLISPGTQVSVVHGTTRIQPGLKEALRQLPPAYQLPAKPLVENVAAKGGFELKFRFQGSLVTPVQIIQSGAMLGVTPIGKKVEFEFIVDEKDRSSILLTTNLKDQSIESSEMIDPSLIEIVWSGPGKWNWKRYPDGSIYGRSSYILEWMP